VEKNSYLKRGTKSEENSYTVGEVEVRVLAVTKFSPGRSCWAMEANL
jgi:hypothetical protein